MPPAAKVDWIGVGKKAKPDGQDGQGFAKRTYGDMNRNRNGLVRPDDSATRGMVGTGSWKRFDFSMGEEVRPRPESGGSNSFREETQPMEMIAPVNPLAEAIGRLLPLAEKWLEKQVGQVEKEPSVASEAPAPSAKEWYTPEEASAEINRTPNHVRELCRKKIFGKRDAGGRWVIHRKELEAFRLGRLKVHGEAFK